MNAEQRKTEAPARLPYTAPTAELIPIDSEGIIAGSPGAGANAGGYDPGNWASTQTYSRRYTPAGSSDLEDLINDILTVEQ